MCLLKGLLLSVSLHVCVYTYLCVSVHVCVCCVADYKRGFGGRYGVEVEKQDQCALGYEHKESLAKHESQKGTDTSPPDPERTTLPHLPFQTPTLLKKCFLLPAWPCYMLHTHPPLQHQPVNVSSGDESWRSFCSFCVHLSFI